MAAPKVKFKRSSVAHKAPGLANLELGELALNTYDGKLFTRKDTGGVGIATTVTVLNPWDENYGGGSITYAGIVTSGGGGSSTDYTEITVSGFTPSSFNQTYQRQSTGFTLDTGTVSSGNALFNTNSNYYYYTATTGTDSEDRMIIFSEEDNAWFAVFSFDDPDYTSNNNNEALGPTGVDVFAYSIATGSDTADGRNVPPASDSNITYGTSVGGITTSRVGVVTITQDGHAQYAGVVTAYSFSGDISGNLTGSVTGTASSASVANQVFTQRNENTNANFYFTFVDDNNVAPSANTLYTDTSLNVNPYTNIIAGGGCDMVAYFINSVQITSTATELNILDGATLSTSELNILDGVTASTSELNILDGVTATTAELNYTDGVTSNIQTQLDNIVSLTGVSAGSTTLGTFTGTTISDNKDVKTALQELETALDNVVGGNSGSATILTQSTSTNSSHYLTFVTDNNGSATQEAIKTDAGISYNPSTNILSVSGSISGNVTGNVTGDLTGTADMADNVSVTNISTTDVDFTLVMSDGSNTSTGRALGMDSSLTYNPNTNVLTAETVIGNLTGNVTGDVTGTASTSNTVKTQLSTTNANHYLTFVNSNNSSATAETVHTDSSLHYNPLTNQFTAPGVNVTILSIDGTDVTSTAAELNILDGVTATAAELNVLDGIASLDTDLTSVSSNDDTLASAKAIKTYVDAQVTASDLDFAGDTGTGAVDLDSQTFTIAGTSNEIETSVSGQTLTVGLPDNVSVFNNLTVGGNITIGGTLTYEDVTNVDSVGIVTARSGVIVNGAGIGLSVTEGGARITGVTTSSGGFVGNLTGNVTGNVTGDVTGTATTATNAVQLQTARNIGGVSFNGTADINLPGVNAAGNQDTTGTAALAEGLTGTPNITVGDVTASSLDISGNVDVDGQTDLDDVVIAGVTTFNNADVVFQGAAAGQNITFDASENDLEFSDNARLKFGNSDDLEIWHSGNSAIKNSTGDFKLRSDSLILKREDDSEIYLKAEVNKSVEIYYGMGGASAEKKFETTKEGVLVSGGTTTGTLSVTGVSTFVGNASFTNNVDVDGTLEADAITIDGVSLAETISDTVGSMVTSNTETGVSVTYDDSDNTLDFVIGTLNQDTSGNAATATALETARNIGGVSFNGTADINLPGVNATGNQDTSGNAATATQLATARTIAGVSFDGTSNISLNNNAITNGAGYITTSFTRTSQLTNDAGFITTSTTATSELNNDVGFITSIVTGDFSVSGNISIGGTLTYEDVTNVDSVGLVTARSGIKVPDNQKINLGTGDDLQIYHDGSHSYIDDAGTGNLRLRSGTLEITNLAGSKKSAEFNSGGAQELYFNNTKRFETTNAGATITGALTAAGLAYPSTDGSANQVIVTDGSGNLSFATQESFASPATGITTTTATTVQTLDTVNKTLYDSVIYDIQAKRGSAIELTKLTVIHDGSETYISEYASMSTGAGIATYTADISGSDLRLRAFPASASETTFKLERTRVGDSSTNVGVASVTNITNISYQSLAPSGVTTTTSTSQVAIDSFDSVTYSAAIYHVQATRGGDTELTNINVLHNGSETFMTEYGTISTGSGIATYSSDISGGNLRLLAFPSSSDSTQFRSRKTVLETSTSASGATSTSSTSTVTIDSVSTTYKSLIYEVEATSGTAVHITTINLVHDGTTAHISEFGTVLTGNSLGTFDADIDSGNVRLRVTPASTATTTFNVKRTTLS